MTILAAQAPDGTLTRDAFLSLPWRVSSLVFAMQPAGGYPITFLADGSVVTGNLALVTKWEFDGRVLRLSSDSSALYQFDWIPREEVFRHCARPDAPAIVIFTGGSRRSSEISHRCDAPDTKSPEVACRLEITSVPTAGKQAIEFRYVLTGPSEVRVSGRYFTLDEQVFGASLRILNDAGQEYRFLRTQYFSYLGHLELDIGEALPVTYRFQFPAADGGDLVRLLPLQAWKTAEDSASSSWSQRAFDAGLRELPPGRYQAWARVSRFMYMTQDRSSGPLTYPDVSRFESLFCPPTRFTVPPTPRGG